MTNFLTDHAFWTAVAAYWIFSAAVGSMPEPGPQSNSGYRWLYRFLHTLAGNIATAFGGRIPGAKAVAAALLIPLLCSAPACAARVAIHPGALNAADSAAFDALLIAQATIDQARLNYEQGRLPVKSKDALNVLIDSYNVARESWLVYRDALVSQTPAEDYFDRLSADLSNLSSAIRAFKEGR